MLLDATMHNYRKLQIYRRAIDLVVGIYQLTAKFPREELFGLTSQTRRAALSVALNIAEGSGASSNREFGRFLDISRRSLYETTACLEVATRLGLAHPTDLTTVGPEMDELAAMISGFKRQLGRNGKRDRATN